MVGCHARGRKLLRRIGSEFLLARSAPAVKINHLNRSSNKSFANAAGGALTSSERVAGARQQRGGRPLKQWLS